MESAKNKAVKAAISEIADWETDTLRPNDVQKAFLELQRYCQALEKRIDAIEIGITYFMVLRLVKNIREEDPTEWGGVKEWLAYWSIQPGCAGLVDANKAAPHYVEIAYNWCYGKGE